MSTSTYTGTYSVPEQIAAFTFSVNSAADFSFTSLADMQAYVTQISSVNLADAVIQGFIGTDWTPVWGPVVWVNPSQTGNSLVADNTMACYYSPSQNLFIIAIAGTNPVSMYDWEDEDFTINSLVQWITISAGAGKLSGYISTAAATGLNILLNDMLSSNTSLLNTLQTYISSNNITGATIAVGGHSLGGALAPCLGLYMSDNLSALGLTGQNIAVYAYAGPTPGNSSFATYYENQVNGTSFCYSSQYNSLDIVPMGMVPATLANIPGVYDFKGGIQTQSSEVPANVFMGILSCAMQVAGATGTEGSDFFGGAYTQVSTNYNESTGTFNIDVDSNCGQSVANLLTCFITNGDTSYTQQFSNLVRFMYQAAAQHGPAYCGGTLTLPCPTLLDSKNTYTTNPVSGFLGIDAFTAAYQLNLTNNPPANATFESGFSRAIKKITGIDLAKIPAKK